MVSIKIETKISHRIGTLEGESENFVLTEARKLGAEGGFRVIGEIGCVSERFPTLGELDQEGPAMVRGFERPRLGLGEEVLPTILRIYVEEGEHGSFAQAKMNVLRRSAKILATGCMPVDFWNLAANEFCHRRDKNGLLSQRTPDFGDQRLIKAIDHDLSMFKGAPGMFQWGEKILDRNYQEWLRDELGLCYFIGGFRLPLTVPRGSVPHEKLELRVAASGFPDARKDLELAMSLCIAMGRFVKDILYGGNDRIHPVQTSLWQTQDFRKIYAGTEAAFGLFR